MGKRDINLSAKHLQTLFDALTNALVSIEYGHHEAHEGHSFISDVVNIAMADEETLVLAFKTPIGTKRVHMLIDFATLAGGHVDIIEGPTWDSESGSLHSIYNRKREASMINSDLLEDSGQPTFTATNNLILNPTNLAGGIIPHDLYGFGKKEKFPAQGRDTNELILKPDTQYDIKFISDAGSNKGHLILNWYEHIDIG